MRLKARFFGLALLGLASGASAEDHLLAGLASAVAGASIAEDRCPGMRKYPMGEMKILSHMAQEGFPPTSIRIEIERQKKNMLAGFEKTGAKDWCRSAWEVFGPDNAIKTIKGE